MLRVICESVLHFFYAEVKLIECAKENIVKYVAPVLPFSVVTSAYG